MNPADLTRVFAYDETMIRVLGTAEAPRFVAKDVCHALGIENHRDTVAKVIPEDERGVDSIYTPGHAETGSGAGMQTVLVITEAGLYRLIFRSDKSEAKRFQDWVFKEVLPSIRKTGSYDTVSWLRAAYDNAKTGKVQLALLSAMGIDPVEVRGGASDMAQEIDVDAFWSDARQLVEGKAPLKEYFRVEVRRDGWLLKMNFAFIAFLKSSLPEKYTGYAPSDFKASLAMDSGWQPGTYKVRFGKDGSMAVGAAWLWLVKPESNTDQLALVKLVEEVSHAN